MKVVHPDLLLAVFLSLLPFRAMRPNTGFIRVTTLQQVHFAPDNGIQAMQFRDFDTL
jgi:hypothetical protein